VAFLRTRFFELSELVSAAEPEAVAFAGSGLRLLTGSGNMGKDECMSYKLKCGRVFG
jgi:hypothetical protein